MSVNKNGLAVASPQSGLFEILDSINKQVDIPLVLHGGSGISEKDLPKLIEKLEKDMHKAAKILDFERAAQIRDQLKKLREMVN